MEVAFDAAVERDAIEDKIRAKGFSGRKALSDLAALVRDGIITQAEADSLARDNAIIRDAIDVDDFAPAELTVHGASEIRSAAAAE